MGGAAGGRGGSSFPRQAVRSLARASSTACSSSDHSTSNRLVALRGAGGADAAGLTAAASAGSCGGPPAPAPPPPASGRASRAGMLPLSSAGSSCGLRARRGEGRGVSVGGRAAVRGGEARRTAAPTARQPSPVAAPRGNRRRGRRSRPGRPRKGRPRPLAGGGPARPPGAAAAAAARGRGTAPAGRRARAASSRPPGGVGRASGRLLQPPGQRCGAQWRARRRCSPPPSQRRRLLRGRRCGRDKVLQRGVGPRGAAGRPAPKERPKRVHGPHRRARLRNVHARR